MNIELSIQSAAKLVDLIDDLVRARVDHAVSNRHNHEYPSSEDEIRAAQAELQEFLDGTN